MAMYITTTVVLKLSLAIFFLRVIPHGWQRKVLYIATAIYTAYGTAFTFIIIFQCGNPHDFFINEAQGKCIPDTILQPLYYTAGAMNALTDWIFSILPVTVLWSAAIPRSTKISAGCLLGLGSLASISSLIRLAYIPGIRASPTFLAHAVNIACWSIVEPGLGIVAASLATLRPLYRYCFPGKRNSARKGRPTLRQGGLDYDIVFGAEGFGTTTFICADCHDTPTKTHGLEDEKCGSLAPRGRGRSIPIYPKYDSSEDYIKATTVTSQDSSSTYDQFPTPPKQDKQTQRCSKVNEV